MGNNLPKYTINEIENHTSKEDLWIIYDNYVYDITKIVNKHPGGEKLLLKFAGKDVTQDFKIMKHDKNKHIIKLMKKLIIGKVIN